jgi:hypothetical protein
MSNPYDQNPYAAGGGFPQPHPKGTTVLVLGIVSLFVCGIILGPIALIQGNRALREIDANPGAYTNRQHVAIGRILGIVAIVLWVIGIIINIFVLGAGITTQN